MDKSEGSYTCSLSLFSSYVHAPEIKDNTNVIENRVTPEKEVNIKNVKQGYTKKQVFQPFFTPNNQESNGHDSIVTLLKKHTVTDDIPSPTSSGTPVNSTNPVHIKVENAHVQEKKHHISVKHIKNDPIENRKNMLKKEEETLH